MTGAAKCPPGGHQKQDGHGPRPSWAEAGAKGCQASKVHNLTLGPAVPDPSHEGGARAGEFSLAFSPGEAARRMVPLLSPLRVSPRARWSEGQFRRPSLGVRPPCDSSSL